MYSYEERLLAVKLYIKLGRRCKATIRQLGYATKNSIKAWHNEFQERGDLKDRYVRPKAKYSEEQKIMALDHYANHGRCIAHAARALGYPGRAKLREWVRERYPETAHHVIGKSGSPRVALASKRAAVYELCTRGAFKQTELKSHRIGKLAVF